MLHAFHHRAERTQVFYSGTAFNDSGYAWHGENGLLKAVMEILTLKN
jgi:hypothetical protein